jgi:hypothetical protein
VAAFDAGLLQYRIELDVADGDATGFGPGEQRRIDRRRAVAPMIVKALPDRFPQGPQ